MNPVIETYRALLEQLDRRFEIARREHPDILPCRRGCSACCYGPFDISTADLLLVREGVRKLPREANLAVRDAARALLARIAALAPDWTEPYDLATLGEERFDDIADTLAPEPCPLLDQTGGCRIYQHRPLICRLMGLGLISPGGRTIPNECPIQEDFPFYANLPPQPFDLETFEEAELACLEAAAVELFGSPTRAGFETTIAAALVSLRS